MAFFPMKKKTIDNNTVDTTTTWSSSKILDMIYPIGSIIQSTTLDTEDKVKAQYGGNTWIQHSGYVLRGATSGVVANSTTKDGGSDDAVAVSHSHEIIAGTSKSTSSDWHIRIESGTSQYQPYYIKTNGVSGTNKNIPNYKSVYIWERTA